MHACELQAAEPAAPQATWRQPLPQLYHGQLYNAVLKLALAPLHPDAAASCSVHCADTQDTALLSLDRAPCLMLEHITSGLVIQHVRNLPPVCLQLLGPFRYSSLSTA